MDRVIIEPEPYPAGLAGWTSRAPIGPPGGPCQVSSVAAQADPSAGYVKASQPTSSRPASVLAFIPASETV
jgi:hypothetical protein